MNRKQRVEQNGHQSKDNDPWSKFSVKVMDDQPCSANGRCESEQGVVSDGQVCDAQKKQDGADNQEEAHGAIW